MAYAPEEFHGNGAVKAGIKALTNIQLGAIARGVNKYKTKHGKETIEIDSTKDWQTRLKQLRYFRILANMPDPSKSVENLVLPPDAFPKSGLGSNIDTSRAALELSREMERTFGRTGFVKEGDGSVSPVNAHKGSTLPSSGGQSPLQRPSVKDLMGKFQKPPLNRV